VSFSKITNPISSSHRLQKQKLISWTKKLKVQSILGEKTKSPLVTYISVSAIHNSVLLTMDWNIFWSSKRIDVLLKSRGPILRVTSSALGSDDLTLDQSATSIQILPEPALVTWHVFFIKLRLYLHLAFFNLADETDQMCHEIPMFPNQSNNCKTSDFLSKCQFLGKNLVLS